MELLPFQKQIILDLYPEDEELHLQDALVLIAKGLGQHILPTIISLHSTPKNLVFLLNHPDPKITSQIPQSKRKALYLDGGLISITDRILIVDLLLDVVPVHLITGIVIWNCHYVSSRSITTFILSYYRRENKQGFIKGVSDQPSHFIQLEKMLKRLLIRNVYPWPRFQVQVANDLEVGNVNLIEIRVPMSTAMQAIQSGLVDCLNISLMEIKKFQLDDEIALEELFFSEFDYLIRQRLANSWHTMGKTKQIIYDIPVLRQLLTFLCSYDCVTFYKLLDTILKANKPTVYSNPSPWLLFDSSDQVFSHAKNRVYEIAKDREMHLVLEAQPKWQVLLNIIDEIPSGSQILIIASGRRTCNNLSKILCDKASDKILQSYFVKFATESGLVEQKLEKPPISKRRRVRGGHAPLGTRINPSETTVQDLLETLQTSQEVQPDFQVEIPSNIHIRSYSEQETVLNELKPSHVILYEPNMEFIRLLEIYKIKRDLTVYLMVYDNSIEEQQYLQTIRKEKEAFEKVIVQKQNMAIPIDSNGRVEVETLVYRESGGTILVDMREFRSSLPGMIFAANMQVIPCTLKVGDYILAPQVCVERKSPSDLAQSLKSGRLYTQCQGMFQCYSTVLLLIEFENSILLGDEDLFKRLTALILTFPQLRVLWSPDPLFSALLFVEIKENLPEPILDRAVEEGVSQSSIELLTGLPGINEGNVEKIIKNCSNLRDLATKSLHDLQSMIGNDNGKRLHSFFNREIKA